MLGSIMDPATLALTAAALIAKKALEAAGDQAGKTGWQALGRIAHDPRLVRRRPSRLHVDREGRWEPIEPGRDRRSHLSLGTKPSGFGG
jgi:hypothetical protein